MHSCARPEDFLANQQAVLGSLWAYCPGQFQSGLWAMDSVHFRCRAGRTRRNEPSKRVCWACWQDSVVWPMLWMLVAPSEAEITVGGTGGGNRKRSSGSVVFATCWWIAALVDGAWLSELHARGTPASPSACVRTSPDMGRHDQPEPPQQQVAAEAPQIHGDPAQAMRSSARPRWGAEWDACAVPLSACLIRDTRRVKSATVDW